MAGNFTVFTNDSGAAGGAIDYVKDVFRDVSLEATNNSGLTDNSNTNPLSEYFNNTDAPQFGAKTLYIKDLVLISDRSKWVQNKPTYKVIFNESFPEIKSYIFGNFNITYERTGSIGNSALSGQPIINIKNIGDGIGVTGVMRRVAFLVNDNTAAAATAQVVVDGSNGNTIDFSGLSSASDGTITSRFSQFVHASSNMTNDLHDVRLTALQVNTLQIIGVTVYFENTGENIANRPGVTYVDKNKITTTVGATFAVQAYGSSLGGNCLVYKNTSTGYEISALSSSTVISVAQGTSGTNLLNVSTGHGGSFPVEAGIVAQSGTSLYFGVVKNVSTDTLTVSPTLSFGVSGAIYRAWLAGSTYSISNTYYDLTKTIDVKNYFELAVSSTTPLGLTQPILDPYGNFALYGFNIGVSIVDSVPALIFLAGTGYISCEGRFHAAEVEYIGSGTNQASFLINQSAVWSISEGQTGPIKRTVVTSLGGGWNNFQINTGLSMGALGIAKINLYERAPDPGVSYGHLGMIETNQALGDGVFLPTDISKTVLGMERRVYPDQLYLKGLWSRSATFSSPSGWFYYGTSTNSSIQFQYYGKEFMLLGSPGTSAVLSLDGNSIGVTFGTIRSVATEGFHSIVYTHHAGTCIIKGIDYRSTHHGLFNLQNVLDKDPEQAETEVQELQNFGGDVFSSGSVSQIIASAYVTNGGTPVVSSQDGFWISSITDGGAGLPVINILSGVFSVAPRVVGCVSSNSTGIFQQTGTVSTTTVINVNTKASDGSNQDYNFHIIAIGAR